MSRRGCARGRSARPSLSGEGSSIGTGLVSPLSTQLDRLSLTSDEEKLPRTRPDELKCKRGESGQSISLVANYIKILAAPKWDLFRYHCSFEPEQELRKARRELLAKAGVKDVAFDGTQLYSFEDFGLEKLVSVESVSIRIKRTDRASPESPEFFHLANLIVRKLLEIAGLKLLGRNYYSFEKKIDLTRQQLTLFPGFMTAVNVYEGQLMLNVDLSTKVMNKQTVYSILMEKFQRLNDVKEAQDASLKELIGQIVLTPYNNETYRVLDIAWDKDPTMPFDKRDGSEQTLSDYYREVILLLLLQLGSLSQDFLEISNHHQRRPAAVDRRQGKSTSPSEERRRTGDDLSHS